MADAPKYPHIASRIFDTPLLIEESKLNAILHAIGPRLEIEVPVYEGKALEYAAPDRHMDAFQQVDTEFADEGYYVVGGRTAVIPVLGTLVQRGDWMSSMSGMVSYDHIAQMFAAAMNNPAIKNIIMEYDSPGGEVAGAFDLADMMYESRGKKPVIAVANEFAASAAYLLASTADELVVNRTGSVGSIGVVGAHHDYSKALEKRGVAVTFVYAGDKKIAGNPYQPLSPETKAEWQAEINNLYDLFVNTVSRNMDIGVDRVRGTQAGMFMGFKAVDNGLADRVNTFTNELSNAVLRMNGPFRSMRSVNKEKAMQTEQEAKAQADAKAQAEATARAEAETKQRAEASRAVQASGDAERQRVKGIINHAEAKGRETLANHLAFETNMSVEEAGKLLAASAKQAAEGRLGPAMEQAHNRPGIASEQASGDAPKISINPNEVYARRAQQARDYAASRK